MPHFIVPCHKQEDFNDQCSDNVSQISKIGDTQSLSNTKLRLNNTMVHLSALKAKSVPSSIRVRGPNLKAIQWARVFPMHTHCQRVIRKVMCICWSGQRRYFGSRSMVDENIDVPGLNTADHLSQILILLGINVFAPIGLIILSGNLGRLVLRGCPA